MSLEKTANPPGWADGYRDGWSEGYRLGKCELIANQTRFEAPVLEVKVLFVQSGLWSYAPIDQGILAALQQLVREVQTVTPSENVAAAAANFRPDLVLSVNSVECLKTAQVDELRGMGLRTAVWFTDDPYFIDVTMKIAPHYDYVFTLEEACVPIYQEQGCANVFHMPLAANTSIYYPRRAERGYEADICFIGSAFRNRIDYFDRIAPYLKSKRVFIAGYWWERMANYPQLAGKIRTGVWISPEETASYYNRAKIVINLHRSVDDDSNRNSLRLPAFSVNPRSFEIGACAAFQLTDTRPALAAAFAPGTEAVTFESPEELIEKAEYYLQREDERRTVALNGYARTMMEHTYPRRVRQLLDTIFV
jgi:spore maturation protein CgeB